MNYKQTLDYLQSFPNSETAKTSTQETFMPLASMHTLLKHLDNPQKAARTIHVTGSKGKGSTATFIAAILKSAGYRTALFTSPHLHSYRERIAFDLEPISEASFAQGVMDIQAVLNNEEALAKLNLSTFGFLTALFFYLVNKATPKIDWKIVEVGLGGKTDATNVFDNKDIAVITPISLEHTAILGQTVFEIAGHKAGIITAGCTTVLAPQRDPIVPEIIKQTCQEQNVALINVDEVYKYESLSYSRYGQQFALTDKGKRQVYKLHMLGKHQIENATTAIATIAALQNPLKGSADNRPNSPPVTIKESAIQDGLSRACAPGRFELFKSKNSKASTIILDCAHNQDSARALAQTIKEIFPSRQCIFVIGVNQDKHLEQIYAELKEITKLLIATASSNPRAMPPSEIGSRLTNSDAKLKIISTDNSSEALSAASTSCTPTDLICITGSFYLVAEARELLLTNK